MYVRLAFALRQHKLTRMAAMAVTMAVAGTDTPTARASFFAQPSHSHGELAEGHLLGDGRGDEGSVAWGGWVGVEGGGGTGMVELE